MSRPHIHFIKENSLENLEVSVNTWVDSLEFTCTILTINILPMMLEGHLVFISAITFVPKPTYAPA